VPHENAFVELLYKSLEVVALLHDGSTAGAQSVVLAPTKTASSVEAVSVVPPWVIVAAPERLLNPGGAQVSVPEALIAFAYWLAEQSAGSAASAVADDTAPDTLLPATPAISPSATQVPEQATSEAVIVEVHARVEVEPDVMACPAEQVNPCAQST
jgi:alkylated DNA repair dioxygenase AlkB